ncbi:MAG: beta-lactamase family protein, partial [Clostridiales bacterium]|nr:beta-lactamase family protein [Clostridiales bacterium]
MLHFALFDGVRLSNIEQRLGLYGIHVYTPKGEALHEFRSGDRTHLFSGSKTFTSMAIGIAEGEGLLSLEDRALDFFPELKKIASPGWETATVKDLLQMRAGVEEGLFASNTYAKVGDPDRAELFFARTLDNPPGTSFWYDNGCTYILSRIIKATSGVSLKEYLMPRLFVPLGIDDPLWSSCVNGHNLGAVGLHLNTEEFSRLGRLMLFRGEWEGKQLVPAGYLERARTDLVKVKGFPDPENNHGYGYQLWACTIEGAYRADGKYGQFSIVVPDMEAVITTT